MNPIPRAARAALLPLLIWVGGSTGCVVTTFEGPSEPPRVAPVPLAPGAAARADEPSEIAASHILIQYKGALHAGPGITRTKAEARALAGKVLAKARAGEDFGKLAAKYSDEPGAAARGGSLGHFSRNMMVQEFSDAAFKLKVGQLSGVVETPFGFHVIKRTE
jgi:parvulin-like peptidyl-prolyl isomerase